MRKSYIILGYLLAVSLFIACDNQSGSEAEGKEQTSSSQKKGNFTNPNKDSELTLLMREVFEKTGKIKARINQQQPLPDWYANYLDQLTEIHTATPTDESIKDETFFAFIKLLNQNAQELAQTPDKEHYTQLVNSCIKCHQVYCPGPIVRIKKLYVK